MSRGKINIDYPEEHFGAEALSKGFSLFRRNLIELSGRDKENYYLLIGNKNKEEVSLRLSKNTIEEYACTCRKSLCAHLCAAAFFLRKENYPGLEKTQKLISNSSEKLYRKTEKEIQVLEPFNSYEELLKHASEMKQRGNKINFLLSALVFFLRSKSLKFNQAELNELFLMLAKTKVKKDEADFLYFAIKESLKSQKKFESEAWFFLLPFLCPYLTRTRSEELKLLFASKKAGNYFPGNIIRKEVGLSYLKTFNGAVMKEVQSAEFYIASAMINFSKEKKDEAFRVLNTGFEFLSKQKSVSLGGFLQFMIEKAGEYHEGTIQAKCLRELVIIEPFVSPAIYQTIDGLLPEKERELFYGDLVKDVKQRTSSNEKVFEILFHQRKWHETIKEIRISKGKFSLLNKVALEMLPDISEELLRIYPDFLIAAINTAGDSHYRDFLFEQAGKFLNQIPERERKTISEKVRGSLGKSILPEEKFF